MRQYEKEDWMFLNCNSPADLCAQYDADHSVLLKEHDRCRNGHMLVSNFHVDGDDTQFTTRLLAMEDGAGIGFYYGNGDYDRYLLAVFQENRVSLRIPNGVPLGDTFRYRGPKRYYEIGEASVHFTLPLWVTVKLNKNKIEVWIDQEEVLSCDLPRLSWRRENARILIQALSTADAAPTVKAAFREFKVSGMGKCHDCRGQCIWEKDRQPAAHVSLHLAGERNRWTVTDDQGNFTFANLPEGEYRCVAAGKTGFSSFPIRHYEASCGLWNDKEQAEPVKYRIPEPESGRMHIPEGELRNSHPRVCLDGIWQFEWDPEAKGEQEAWFKKKTWQRRIQVPFSWQSLEGFGEGFLADSYHLRQNNPWTTNPAELGNTGWYQKTFCLKKAGSWALVIGAVNGFGKVWLDEELLGSFESSYEPVRLFLGAMEAEREYRLTIQVTYPFEGAEICKGKQGFWFTDAPGIWQDVWLEAQGELRIVDILLSYEFRTEDLSRLELKGQITVEKRPLPETMEKQDGKEKPPIVEILLDDKRVKARLYPEEQSEKTDRTEILQAEFSMELDSVHLWSPQDPYCYVLKAQVKKEGYVAEESFRKAGFRLIEAVGNRLFLNRKPFYMRGVLDQGYNPWGLYTYPKIEGMEPGSMEFDIRKAKEYGYNLIRMHIKDNEPDWYRICDETGMLVWDEVPVSFYATFRDVKWRKNYEAQLWRMIRKQNYHPGVILFSAFNESWGLSGDHEKSPWDEPEGQAWQKEMAQRYRTKAPQVLLVDNSGYGKTVMTQILDYHMYPESYSEARAFFERLTKQNYPGSVFNCYGEENRKLMQEDAVRDLLQRTCRMNLKETDFKGKECQSGQPVIISEFLHTNQIEQMIRLYPEIAGFVRMNLTSQENEDTSPLTSTRMERDFGYIHSDFSPAGYGCVNSENLVLLDYPPLTRQKAGSTVELPVYVSLWDEALAGERLLLKIIGKGIDQKGRENILFYRQEIEITGNCYTPYEAAKVRVKIPGGMKGIYWFSELWRGEKRICDSSIQMEIMEISEEQEVEASCNPARPVSVQTSGITGYYEKVEPARHLFWMAGEGELVYHLPLPAEKGKAYVLRMEVSTCECMAGTRLSDARAYGGRIQVSTGEKSRTYTLSDAPWDRRALFSNSSGSLEEEILYQSMGTYGYGYQIEIPVEQKDLELAEERGYLTLEIRAEETGLVLYGERMGRYGADPMLITIEKG